jgi:hypothetical protein
MSNDRQATDDPEGDTDVAELLGAAVVTDGAHHKQWYLERIAAMLGVRLPDHEPGIVP